MQFFNVVALLAATAVALPNGSLHGVTDAAGAIGRRSAATHPAPQGATFKQAQDACGSNTKVSCCQSASTGGKSSSSDSGLLGGALSGLLAKGGNSDGLARMEGCSELVGVADNLLSKQCSNNVACCDHSGTKQDGLVNLGLPCLALSSLL